MKKLYFFFLMCFISVAAYAQQTIVIWDTAAVGTNKSGHASPTFRFDDTIKVSMSPMLYRGYAVFDLATLPPNATVTYVEFGYYVVDSQWAVTIPPATFETRGIPGSLAGITTPAALMAAMTGGTVLWNTDYGAPGHRQFTSTTSPATTFFQGQAGNKVSLALTLGDACTWTIMGESGIPDPTVAFHAPYLKITYTCAALSTPVATAAPSPLCEFDLLTLSASATAAVSYTWKGPHGFTTTGATATAVADTTGQYTVIARNSQGCFYTSLTNTVTVNPAPVASITTTTDTTFCAGGSVLLDATTPTVATDTFQWFLNGVPIPGATNPTYLAASTGNYKVRVTNIIGCKNTSRQKQVLELNGPGITPAGSISACTGGSILLTANTGGGFGGLGFQWKRNGITIPGATNSSYPVTTSGNYSLVVRVISDPTCTFTVPPTVVSIFPIPVPVITNVGGTFSTPNLYTNYQWYLNSFAIPGATSYTYVPVANGSYNVHITDYNGCSNYSNTLVVGNVGAGVKETGNVAVAIYPNPATKMVKIDAPVPVRATICGMEGKTIIEKDNVVEMDISHLPAGMYLIYVYGEDGKKLAVQKLIKQ